MDNNEKSIHLTKTVTETYTKWRQLYVDSIDAYHIHMRAINHLKVFEEEQIKLKNQQKLEFNGEI